MRLKSTASVPVTTKKRHDGIRVDVRRVRRRTGAPMPVQPKTVSVMTAPPMMRADVERDDRRDRDQRVAERVAHDDRALR